MRVRLLCLCCLLLVLPKFALADTIYTYTGNDFTSLNNNASMTYTTSDFVTVTLDLSSPLAANLAYGSISPTSFSISDGVQTITNKTAYAPDSSLKVSTDAAGNIVDWEIYADTGPNPNIPPYAFIETYDNSGFAIDHGHIAPKSGNYSEGYNENAAGTWTSPTLLAGVAPEPSGVVLLGTGMMSLVEFARRRRQNAPPGQ